MKFINKIYLTDYYEIKFLGLTIYKKIVKPTFVYKKYLSGFFKVKEYKLYNLYYILGVQLPRTTEAKIVPLLEKFALKNYYTTERLIKTSLLHQKTFSEYKNINAGKEVVILGAGPTLNKYVPIKNAVHIGVNRTFLFDKVNLDYLFAIDKEGIKQYYKEFTNYKGNNCIKFIGDQNIDKNFQIPEDIANQIESKRYKTTGHYLPDRFALDLEASPIGNFATVTLQAMQFALYTNPKKIYLVGIDCNISVKGHFVGKTPDNSTRGQDPKWLDGIQRDQWFSIKPFLEMYYPNIEVISINPIGLKGLFKDIYTDENGNFTNMEDR